MTDESDDAEHQSTPTGDETEATSADTGGGTAPKQTIQHVSVTVTEMLTGKRLGPAAQPPHCAQCDRTLQPGTPVRVRITRPAKTDDGRLKLFSASVAHWQTHLWTTQQRL